VIAGDSLVLSGILHDWVRQAANTADGDGNFVAVFQSEIVVRHDAGARHQECTIGNVVLAE
jgi:hypothetical protein